MEYLVFLGLSIFLLVAFFFLVEYETRRGVRLLAPQRARLDASVERTLYIWTHVDLLAFAREEIRALLGRISHTIAHLVLRAVRLVERTLTRIVRHLRTTAVETEAPRETAREFVRTLSDFKETLEATHPEVLIIPDKRAHAEDRRKKNDRRDLGVAEQGLE